jgi:hypothetical protein
VSSVLLSFILELQNLKNLNAQEIITSGFSAGGLSAILHADKFVVGLPDSGVFKSYRNQ